MLPPRKTKERKDPRWRSPAHRAFVRSFHCAMCGEENPIECAHVRMLGNGGMGFKPPDWDTVPLCGGANGCHQKQHNFGERTFWALYKQRHGQTVEQLIDALCRASPKAHEIRKAREQ